MRLMRTDRIPAVTWTTALVALRTFLGVIYLSLPYGITKPMSWWYVSPRIPALMAPLLLLFPLGRLVGKERVVMIPLIVACCVLPLKLAQLYRSFSNRNAGFMHLLAEVPRGSKTMVVVRGMMRGA